MSGRPITIGALGANLSTLQALSPYQLMPLTIIIAVFTATTGSLEALAQTLTNAALPDTSLSEDTQATAADLPFSCKISPPHPTIIRQQRKRFIDPNPTLLSSLLEQSPPGQAAGLRCDIRACDVQQAIGSPRRWAAEYKAFSPRK